MNVGRTTPGFNRQAEWSVPNRTDPAAVSRFTGGAPDGHGAQGS